jgi:Stage II sporulation protein E (SpoIIE)
MARCIPEFLLSIALSVCSTAASTQLAASSQAPPAPSLGAEHVTLGQAVVPLYGPWKFTIGDSPIDPLTHAPLWAEATFDDSAWENVDLTPESGAFDSVSGLSEYVPGWTAKGHPGYWGYAWYRIRVQLESRPGANLALAGSSNVDDAYQAFDNGKLVGSFGNFAGAKPTIYFTQPMMFPLPLSQDAQAGSSTQVLAFRVWMEPNTLTEDDNVGGLHTPPLLGEVEAISARHQMRWDELVRAYAGSLMEGLLFCLLGMVALSLTLFDRSDKVYLWIGATLLSIATDRFLSVAGVWTQWVGAITISVASNVILEVLIFAGLVMVWRVWFRLRRPTWIPWMLAVLAALLMLSISLGQNLFFTIVPPPVSHAFELVSLWLRVAVAILMLFTVFQGIREQGLEGWVVLPAVLLACISEFVAELQFLHILQFWFPFGMQVTLRELANMLLAAVLALLLLRRLVLSIRRQRQLALDVKQAQEVQLVILPESRTVLPGLVVESEYRPAREVGGDFFQIIPNKSDGSLLIVAGDVTGKGLKAGMLVALLVGAVRSTSDWSTDPLVILKALNQRLMGRSDAQATCLAVRITKDGTVTLANAGHITPYLNGEPIAMEGALPLGMIEGAEFSVMHFQLNVEDKLVVMSDGVAEAADADGHLFGFERVHELLRNAKSASEVANAAESFGQEDDISIISVTRNGSLVPAAA